MGNSYGFSSAKEQGSINRILPVEGVVVGTLSSNGKRRLAKAACCGQLDGVEFLVEGKADVHEKCKGKSASLMDAADCVCSEVVTTVIKNDAVCDPTSDGRSKGFSLVKRSRQI